MAFYNICKLKLMTTLQLRLALRLSVSLTRTIHHSNRPRERNDIFGEQFISENTQAHNFRYTCRQSSWERVKM